MRNRLSGSGAENGNNINGKRCSEKPQIPLTALIRGTTKARLQAWHLDAAATQRFLDIYKSIRPIDVSDDVLESNACRLCACYNREFISDDDLFARVANQETKKNAVGVNNFTERHTTDSFMKLLQDDNTTALEVPDPHDQKLAPKAFLIFRHPGTTQASQESFKNYIHKKQFPPGEDRMRVRGGRDDKYIEYLGALDSGDLMYIDEFISDQDQEATLALLLHLVREETQQLEEERGRPFKALIAKCLDGVYVGSSKIGSKIVPGNKRITSLIESLGMETIGTVAQDRELKVKQDDAALRKIINKPNGISSLQRTADGKRRVPSKLIFGLDYADRDEIVEKMQQLGAARVLSRRL